MESWADENESHIPVLITRPVHFDGLWRVKARSRRLVNLIVALGIKWRLSKASGGDPLLAAACSHHTDYSEKRRAVDRLVGKALITTDKGVTSQA